MERLKAVVCAIPDALHCNLHSSMERLKAACRRVIPFRVGVFTFQYGEIKRYQRHEICANQAHLHSSMERLKVVSGDMETVSILIYIPVWRD